MNYNVAKKTENDCCGCEACAQLCPHHCICMKENDRGFLLPMVDETQCVLCGMCISHCPEQKAFQLHKTQTAYAAIAKDREEQKKSTSGGLFGIMADWVLQHKGVVFGCTQENVTEIKHIAVQWSQDIDRIRQSKYVQSRIGTAYKEAKQMLMNNQIVLFSGTACQIAGLYAFLGKEYDSLYTVEVACHGVPSPGLFRSYVSWREKQEGSRMVRFRFRHRDLHNTGEHYKSCAEFENGKKEYYLVEEDPYYGSFIAGKTLRGTCYHCRYKNVLRIADLTLCDFWGIEKEFRFFPAQYGASAVLVNTKKGHKLFTSIESQILAKKCSTEAVLCHNHSLTTSATCDEDKRYKSANADQMELLLRSLSVDQDQKRKIKKIVKGYVPGWLIFYLKRLR